MSPVQCDAITAQWTVNEVLRARPESIAVLSRFQVDSCCGGEDTLAAAAEREGIDLAVLLGELRKVATGK
jgi:iron-sulfur cluster repair protein YtfE (RIC family)